MSPWGDDNGRDRKMGDVAEREAQVHFQRALWLAERHPRGKTGPDLRVVSHLGRGEEYLVEVRHKSPTHDSCYGLEENKLALWRELDVLYLIKDWKREGWYVAQMSDLGEPTHRKKVSWGTYRSGRFDPTIRNVFWEIQWWLNLEWEYEEA